MNLKKLTQMLLLTVLLPLGSCKQKHQTTTSSKASFYSKEKNNNACDTIQSKGGKDILCETSGQVTVSISKSNRMNGAELFIEIYNESNYKVPLLFYNDYIRHCPVDFFIDYIEGSLSFTDLDNDEIKEITLAYQKICTGGVEPADIVILKMEGKEIYTISGKRILKIDKKTTKDKHDISPNFSKAPEEFLIHSTKNWAKYLYE